jgi:hypothetical protein
MTTVEVPPQAPAVLPPPAQFARLAMGCAITQMLQIAANLKLADQIAEGPKTAQELAEANDVNPDALYRMLRALAAEGVFAERDDGTFEMTELSQFLHSRAMGSIARHWGADWHYAAWGGLEHSIKTGEPAFAVVHGVDHFTYLREHPDASEEFDASMTATSTVADMAVVQVYEFEGVNTLVDVGGGYGRLLAGILDRHPEMKGVLFERPEVLEAAEAHVQKSGVADRLELVGGDFFETAPQGGDAYILTRILHDWEDAKAIEILKRIRENMPQDAKVLTIEVVIPPGNTPFLGKIIDVGMLTLFGGRERTFEQYAALYEAAGLGLDRLVPTFTPFSILEGTAR